MKLREAKVAEMEAQDTIDIYANGDVIDTTPELPASAPAALPSTPQGFNLNQRPSEVMKEPVPTTAPQASIPAEPPAGNEDVSGQTTLGGPDF